MKTAALIIAVLALAAVVLARWQAGRRAGEGGVAETLRRVYFLVGLLIALRLALAAWPVQLLVSAVMVVASWLPLATLRLGEELARRHAPRPLKLVALGGAVVFSLLAATLGLIWTWEAVMALAAFQLFVIGGVLWHLMANRSMVSLAERRAADLVALALALSIPLLLTDFQRLFPDLAVRGGSFAALLFVLATGRLLTGMSRPAALLGDVALTVGGGALVAAAVHVAGNSGYAMLAGAVAVAVVALALLIDRLVRSREAADSLLGPLGAGYETRAELLASHPLLASAVTLGAEELSDLPADAVAELARHRVVASDDLAKDDLAGGAAAELFERFAASHLLRMSAAPPRFLAISGGALGSDRLTSELHIAARLLENAK
ncbi:hypothetical protein [Erythrobacter sp. HKB08]|uniref:hypothetical protein n=1 Tax=Erythrobacter sp. HKB08 TaxID=2502843 RepID=UPI001008B36E|nr:hypothetical protein [Erythrobacter sp. HKB08]